MNSDFEILWRKWTEHSFDSSRWRRMTEGLSRPAKAGQVKSRRAAHDPPLEEGGRRTKIVAFRFVVWVRT